MEQQHNEFERRIWLYRTLAIIATANLVIVCYNKQIQSNTRLKGDINIFVNIAESIFNGEQPYIDPIDAYMFVYPPMSGIVFIPLINVPLWINVLGMTMLNTALIGVVILLGYEAMTGKRFRSLPLKMQWSIASLTVFFGARYLIYEISSGQVNLIVMSVITTGLYFSVRKKEFFGGVIVGIGTCFKLLTLPLGVWYLSKRDWKFVLAIALGGIVWILLPTLMLGWEKNLDLFSYFITERVLKNAPTATELPFKHIDPTGIALQADNISISAQMIRLFTNTAAFEQDGVLHSITVAELPKNLLSLFKATLVGLLLSLIPFYAVRYREKRGVVFEWGGVALACAVVPAFLPQSHQYHIVTLLPAWLYFAVAIVEWNVRDKWFIGLVWASVGLTILTSPDMIGWFWAKLSLAFGSFLVIVGLTIGAIFRLAEKLEVQVDVSPKEASVQH